MLAQRLSLALGTGGLALPDGGIIVVLHPGGQADLSALPRDRVVVVAPLKPDFDHFTAQGYNCVVDAAEAGAPCAAVLVCLPRAKALAQTLIARAAALAPQVLIIDGQKTDGVDSMLKAVRGRLAVQGPIAKAHGKMFWVRDPAADAVADWAAGPSLTAGGFWTAPGVFSADAVDPASAMLVDNLPPKLGRSVADLGAGWGFLAAHVLTRTDVEVVHLVEADHMALECARRNVTDPRASFHWADATLWQPPHKMDGVVMNPPFHTGRAADPSLGQAFVASAARILAPQGQLWMVANRHLPYETTLEAHFAKVSELGGDARFKVLHAARPARKRG
ncbi:class I SAM-dependent methyltransferase [Sulfitobacter sabulilitoris]|uniref:Class I SAM-dependent methyltransferase n=1 Tax=Sulfitobacter sabulilitoris TaxID=2562655 RepID=A0A5S3PFT1_9RHOB|nr:class I SAM-dependent methyltransferase [Sulfitobacter sabulilitoris]TMM52907.1 class I SAM-dependent methyltransferase [Sulfitobacter sabulilitoris]